MRSMYKAGIVLACIACAGVTGLLVARSSSQRTERLARIEAEAVQLASAAGISLDASRQIVGMGEVRLANVRDADHLREIVMSFERFAGADRRKVASYCVAYMVAPGLYDLGPEHRDVARIAIKSILAEYVEDDQIVGIAYATAAGLGLRDDPYVVSLANQTLASSTVGEGVKRFVSRAMFPPASEEAGPDATEGL